MTEKDHTAESTSEQTPQQNIPAPDKAKDQTERKYKVPFIISCCLVITLFFSLIAVLYIQHASVRQLEFYEETVLRSMPTADETNDILRVNINTADIKELTLLPGIGESRAKDIIDYRNEYGLFTSPEDLLKIRGIGEATVENLLPYITFETSD